MGRLFLSFAIAGFVYEIYWHLVSWRYGVHARWFGRSRAEQSLRDGMAGYIRLLFAWGLVLVVYAFGSGSADLPSTAGWWRASITAGEWAFIATVAPLFAAAEWYFTKQPVYQRAAAEQTPVAPLLSAPVQDVQ